MSRYDRRRNFLAPEHPISDEIWYVSAKRFRQLIIHFLTDLNAAAILSFNTDRFRKLTIEKICCVLWDIIVERGLAGELERLQAGDDYHILIHRKFMCFGRVMGIQDKSSSGYSDYGEYFVHWLGSSKLIDREVRNVSFMDQFGVKLDAERLALERQGEEISLPPLSTDLVQLTQSLSQMLLEIDVRVDSGADSGMLVSLTTLADIEKHLHAQRELCAQIFERPRSNLLGTLKSVQQFFHSYSGINYDLLRRINVRTKRTDSAASQVMEKKQKRRTFDRTFEAICNHFAVSKHPMSRAFDEWLRPYISSQYYKWQRALPTEVTDQKDRLELLGVLGSRLSLVARAVVDLKVAICRVKSPNDVRRIMSVTRKLGRLRRGLEAWNVEFTEGEFIYLFPSSPNQLCELPIPKQLEAREFYQKEWRQFTLQLLESLKTNIDGVTSLFITRYSEEKWRDYASELQSAIARALTEAAPEHNRAESNLGSPTQLSRPLYASIYAPGMVVRVSTFNTNVQDSRDQSLNLKGDITSSQIAANQSEIRGVTINPQIAELIIAIIEKAKHDHQVSRVQFSEIKRQIEVLSRELKKPDPRETKISRVMDRLKSVASIAKIVTELGELIASATRQ